MAGPGDGVFSGVGVALITIFDERGGVEVAATAEHAARLVDLGMRAVVVAGSTGEAAALAPDERAALVTAVRRAVPAAVPVIAGTGAASAHQAIALTTDAAAAGADAALVLSPPGTADVVPYYRRVADAVPGFPVLAYHYPAVSPPGIPVGVLGELPIAGCKDSSGDPDRLLAELVAWDGRLYVGSAAILSLAGPLGCAGAILALANAEPEACIDAFAGDAKAQRGLAESHATAKQAFPQGIKQLTAARWGLPTHARMG
ncbi:MAG: dihydrodipicolinate synthase family protein [Acidobacteria bacterium]|nr:dihydrodipicolinate synthase family protein [Acidobacteriota bacterium]